MLVKVHDSEMKKSFPFSRFSNGGWILDNFPRTREQWNVLVERNSLLPDDVIVLKDDSDNGDHLIKRWYFYNRTEVDEKIGQRIAAEEAERLRKEEEAR